MKDVDSNPYKWNNCEEVQSEVRESPPKVVYSMEFILLFTYRLSFPILASCAYISFFFFNSLHTAQILSVVAGTMAIFDLFLTLVLSIYYDEK